jgi:transposase
MAQVTIDIDLPPGIEITAYERYGDGHGFEVTWPWPEKCRCQCCGVENQARLEVTNRVRVVRDLDVLAQPSFWIYQALWHRCPHCKHRQDVLPPFKRKDTKYTYRFEQYVLRTLMGSNEEETARRLGISAETVARIVKQQLAEVKPIAPDRVITSVGMDEISLKKRHKLYVTILTDLSKPEQPEVLAVETGRDEAAGQKCLEKLSPAQRKQVRSYRVDMGPAYNKACADLLKNAKGVIDRFHVAKLFNEAIDGQRKKNDAALQDSADESGAEGIPVVDVGVSTGAAGVDSDGAREPGEAVCQAAWTRCTL